MVKIISTLFVWLFFVFCQPPFSEAIILGEGIPEFRGFAEFSFGLKMGNDTTKRDEYNFLEQRLQLKTTIYPKFTNFIMDSGTKVDFKGDFTIDEYYSGKTNFELRELKVFLSPLDNIDLKIGRQVLTWGTGDYLFINDLFPKDYESFYIGRDDEYLKKPSDAVKISIYLSKINFDLVAMPFFEPNNIFKGDRLSFFDSFQGGISGRDSERDLVEPSRQIDNIEYSGRVYGNLGSYETAFYFFRGFYKMPRGYLDEINRKLFYPRLDVYGTSIRGRVLGAIMNFEFGFYNSRQDREGNNRLIENSMLKYLLGYDKDLGNDWTFGLQYFYEQILDYSNYREALLFQDFRWDEYRHLTTLRVSKLFKNQTVKFNLFTFYSPSDTDIYIRPSVDYNFTDYGKVTVGANLVWGKDDLTEFGQMENNKNIYIRFRYSF